jgi:aminoglycoside 3-N-acetyltransferase I
MSEIRTKRLASGDREQARMLFALMCEVFSEACDQLSDAYLDGLLGRNEFWAMAALIGEEIVGGATAHTLPMTKSEVPELFLYDIAVRYDQRRKGIGRCLVTALCEQARKEGILEMFVFADNDDVHALDFYRALGGLPSAVTSFTFSLDSVEKEND